MFLQKQLIDDLDKVCALLGKDFEAACKLLVQAEAPQIIAAIAAGLLVSL